jgi:hypothetical protein
MEQKDNHQVISEFKSLIYVLRRVYRSWSGKHFCITNLLFLIRRGRFQEILEFLKYSWPV